ncbi:MAG: tetratricopeptide repeat protein [Bacteroidota bacterium]
MLNAPVVGQIFRNILVFAKKIVFSRLLPVFFLLTSTSVFANIIDSIDIVRAGEQARVTIRFTTEIQYTRHTPDDEGRYLRIFFRVTKPGFSESELMQEFLRSPNSELVPRFTVAYPELINGMLVTFARSTPFVVQGGDDSRSIVILLPAPVRKGKEAVMPGKGPAKELPAPVPAAALPGAVVAPTPDADKADIAPALSADKVETMALAFMKDGREALEKGDFAKAINRMNRILSLPGNAQTMPAQALIGEAREKNGEIAKARAEYELFLKLYPTAPEAAAIRQRLVALPAVDSVRRPSIRLARDDKPAAWTLNGSLSSYYFSGRSQQDSGPMKRDQESQISSVNFNARLRDSVTDTRFVFRDTDSRNYMQPSRNYNRVYAAYAERTDREAGYFLRVGRQNPNGSGVLERFDGITGNYNLSPDWRVGAVYGDAIEFGSPFKKKFYGGNLELLPQVGRPGASLYAIEQNIDGFLNRRAVGSEFRYFDGQFTGYGMLDYDLLYKGMNIGMGQANYLDAWGNNYFVSYDYRKSPSYSLTNALSTAGYTTVADLVGNVGTTQARQLVADSTALSTMFATGVTIPVGEKWQFGLDYRMSEISGTSATIPLNQMCKELQDGANPTDPLCIDGPRGTLRISEMGICQLDSYDIVTKTCRATSEASGRTQMYSAQAIGTNLFVPNGVGVANFGWVAGPTYTGQNLGLSYIYPFIENWRLESNLRYYMQKSEAGQNSNQFSPSMKLVHQWGSSLFLEGEVGYNESKNTGTMVSQNRREYLYLGIRWDYR